MKKLILPFFIALSVVFVSCSTQGGRVLPSASGKVGELIVVVDNAIWNGAYGDSIRSVFGGAQPMLPQKEPFFDMMQVHIHNFSKLFQTHRNIVRCVVSDSVKVDRIDVKRNVWSNDQLFLEVMASTEEGLFALLKENKKTLLYRILHTDRKRIQKYYGSIRDLAIAKKLKERYQLDMIVPEGYQVMKKDTNFMWLQYETTEMIQGLLIYRRPYTDTAQYNLNAMVNLRDSIAKLYVPGPTPDSYMSTYKRTMPEFTAVRHNKKYSAELRGLWEVKNDFMGGPFISLTSMDSARNLLTIEGFVYAPKYNKRNYLRQLEAIIYSAKF